MPGTAGAVVGARGAMRGLTVDIQAIDFDRKERKKAGKSPVSARGQSPMLDAERAGSKGTASESVSRGNSNASQSREDSKELPETPVDMATGDDADGFHVDDPAPEDDWNQRPKQKVRFHDASKFASDGSGGGRSSWLVRSGTASLTSHMWRGWWAYNLISSPIFDASIGFIILVNSVLIGVEQQWDLDGKDITVFGYIEHLFLCLYLFELFVRLWAMGIKTCIMDNWWRFDAFLVITSVLCFWFIFPLWGDVSELQPVAMLRMLRLLRLARAVRLVPLFRELWMLVHGLLVSGKTVVYTVLLIGVILYLYAVMAIELITNNPLAIGEDADPDFQRQVENHFRSLPLTMLTLLQFVSFDNVVLIYEPLVKKDWKLGVYFISIIVLVGILLMNLVTAVVVNSALEQAMADKEIAKAQEETQKKKLIKELRKVFMRLDDDGSGQVTKDEIEKIQPEDKEMLHKLLGVSDPMELFNALDADGSGEVDIDEFCTGVWAVCISKSPIELKRTEKMVEYIRDQLRESEEHMNHMMERLEALEKLNSRFTKSSVRGESGSEPLTPKSPMSPMSPKNAKKNRRVKDRGVEDTEKAAVAKKFCDVELGPDMQLPPGLQACMKEAMRQALLELGGGAALAPCGAATPTTMETVASTPKLGGQPMNFCAAAMPQDEDVGVTAIQPAGADASASGLRCGPAGPARVEHL